MKKSKILAALLAVAIACSATLIPASATNGQQVAAETGSTVIQAFENPDSTAKPMCRMWFPDGWAGEDEFDTVAKQINELAEAGFGGVEIAYLADGSNYSNVDAESYGWGSENWKKTMKKVLKAANAIEGGFTVDITFTAHWPLCINTIDPNDDAASSIQTSSYTKVSGSNVTLELPDDMRTKDALKNPFIFTDKFSSAALVKVSAVGDNGELTLDFDSLIDITDNVSTVDGEGWAAGVPDEATFNAYADAYGWTGTYDSAVVEVFGEEPENFDPDAADNVSNKIDKDFKRARMADWQSIYQADVSGLLSDYTPSEGDEIAAGDYIVVSSYYRGTGQVFSDGGFGGYSESMVNNLYVPNYLDREGIKVITDYWDKYILDDEMLALMEENAKVADPMLFEDSLELVGNTLWSSKMAEGIANAFGEDYAYAAALPIVTAVNNNSSLSFEDEDSEITSQINTDYSTLKSYLYSTEHYGAVSEWSREHCAGYGFRVQIESDICAPVQENIDIIEGDNGTKGDGLRQRTSFKNLMGKDILSMEAVTGMENLSLNWSDVLIEVGQNYSQGVNHVILHGTPYSKSLNGYNAQWPGWSAFGSGFADSYSYRQAYWEDADNLTGYMARTQAVLQTGKDKKDVAVFGNSWDTLLDNGYTYDIVSETMLLNADHATVSTNEEGETVLYADGPEYKAIVLSGVSAMKVACIEKLIEYAQQGLPIYLVNTDINAVSGTEKGEDTVANVTAKFAELKALANVTEVADKDESLLAAFEEDGIQSAASYDDVDNLVATHYEDETDGSNYYFLYNDYNSNANSGMLNAGVGNNLKSGPEINASVTLKGEGTPYLLDAMTGEITPVAAYTDNGDGTITMNLSLKARESMIIGIVSPENQDELPQITSAHALVTTDADADVVYENGAVVFQSNTPGTYELSFSDGSSQTVTVAESYDAIDLSSGWDLTIRSFGPDYSEDNIQKVVVSEIDGKERVVYKDPSQTAITEVSFEGLDLSPESSLWKNLPATAEQLAALGVDKMENVSGIGVYQKNVTLDEWNSSMGAELSLAYNQEEVLSVTVNGIELSVSNLTDTVDIGNYLHSGENTLVVKTATTLLNRALVENEAFDGTQKHPGMQAGAQTYGLKSVVLSPYTKVVVEKSAFNTSILSKVIEYAEQAIASGEVDAAIQDVQDTFNNAYTNAKAVLANHDSQEQIDSAWIELMNAIHQLGFVRGDATMLESLYEYASSLDMDLFVNNDAKAALPDALAAAKAVLDDRGNALESEISTALSKLLDTVQELRYKPDKSILEQVLNQANAIDTTSYTALSVEKFNAAIAQGNEVMQNEDATEQQVEQAVSDLQDAIAGLVLNDAQSQTETPVVTGDSSVSHSSSTPKTGESLPVATAAIGLLAAAAFVAVRRKKQEK